VILDTQNNICADFLGVFYELSVRHLYLSVFMSRLGIVRALCRFLEYVFWGKFMNLFEISVRPVSGFIRKHPLA